MHTAPYFTAFGLLYIVNAWRVISLRRKHRVGLGHGDIPDLRRAIRIFGNFTEWVPIGLILLIALEFVQAPYWYQHVMGGILLLGRIIHSIALLRSQGASADRMIGMILTMFSILLGAVGVSLFSLLPPT